MNYLGHTLDTSMGERISVQRVGQTAEAELALSLDPDHNGYATVAITYLDATGLKALATLCLIAAEEIERDA